MNKCNECLWNEMDNGHVSMCKDASARISGSGCIMGALKSKTSQIKQCFLCGAPIESGSICEKCLSK